MIITKRNLPQTLFVISASTAAKLVAAAMLENDTVDSIQTNQISEVDVTASTAAADMDSTAMHQPEETNDDDDGFFYIPHETDSTLSATFSIRVTPEHYYMVSWMILWLCFVATVVLGLHQIRLERKWLKHVTTSGEASKSGGGNNSGSTNSLTSYRRTRQQLPGSSPSDPELGKTTSYTKAGGRLVRSNRSRDRMIMARSTSSTSVNSNSNQNKQQNSDSSSLSVLSSGDIARATFRRLLLTALISRTIAIPVQIYCDPLWIQLIADTFPVLTFASAWSWLVSFFVQLVGVALGTNIHINLGRSSSGGGNNSASTTNNSSGNGATTPSPGNSNNSHKPVATIDTVIQIIAYVIYTLLIVCFTVFRRVSAAVLLYALLCGVYATLLGMGLYFCPRLLGLLLPGLGEKQWSSPLALRLLVCSIVCLLVFAGHTLSFAHKVVQSTAPSLDNKGNGPYWWFEYGALELFPGFLFLLLLHPKPITTAASSTDSDNPSKSTSDSTHSSGRRTPPLHYLHRRTDSNDSKSGGARKTPSPQPPSRPSPTLTRQLQQQAKESAPLLSSINSNPPRYGSHFADGVPIMEPTYPMAGSDRSAAST